MQFVLQSNGDYSVISTEIETCKQLVEGVLCEVPFSPLGYVEADSWIAAKKKFGFDLTPLQQRILERSNP